jgi:hypothetical protein
MHVDQLSWHQSSIHNTVKGVCIKLVWRQLAIPMLCSGLNNILCEESQTGQMLDRTAGHMADKNIVPSKLFHSQIM